MRVSSINVAQPMKTNYNLHSKNHQNPNFRGKGGILGTLGGTAVGAFLTVASGGALMWTIPLLGGTCGIGGDIYEKKNKPSTEQYGQSLY